MSTMATYYKPPKSRRGQTDARSGSPVRYVGYLRCSNADQAEGDYTTIDTQREMTAAYVQERGGVLIETYADDGVSGTRKRRPSLNRMMADAAAGRFDAVVVAYMSRLGRGDAYTIIEDRLRDLRVRVELVRERYGDDAAGYMAMKAQQFMDGMYPVMVRGWTVDRMEKLHKAGYHLGGRAPLGCKSVPDPAGAVGRHGDPLRVLVADPDTAPIAVAAFDVLIRTRCVMDVADYLSRATGRTWCHHRTAYLLANRTYLGESTWRGITRPNPATAIVEADVFAAGQAILAENGDRTRRRSRRPSLEAANPHAYYLRGLVFCGCCRMADADRLDGSAADGLYRMSTKYAAGRASPVRYYECLNLQKRRGASGCTIKRINADALHRSIVREVSEMAAHPHRIRTHIEAAAKQMPSTTHAKAHLDSVRRRLKENAKARKNLEGAVKAGGAGVISFLARAIEESEAERAILVDEERRLSAEVERARTWRPDVEQLRQTLALFGQVWERRTDEERAELMALLVDRVVMRSRQVAEVTLLPALCEGLRLPAGSGGVSADSEVSSEAVWSLNGDSGRYISDRPNRFSVASLSRTAAAPLTITIRIDSKRIIDCEEVRFVDSAG